MPKNRTSRIYTRTRHGVTRYYSWGFKSPTPMTSKLERTYQGKVADTPGHDDRGWVAHVDGEMVPTGWGP